MSITAFDDLEMLLLTRLTVLQATLPAVKQAVPYFWSDVKAPFAMFLNRAQAIQSDRTRGSGYRRDTWQITMRCVWGSLSAGYKNETEQLMSNNKLSVMNLFELNPHLNDPDTNAAFSYLYPREAAFITNATTLTVQDNTDNAASLYLVTDYALTVQTIYTSGTRSS